MEREKINQVLNLDRLQKQVNEALIYEVTLK